MMNNKCLQAEWEVDGAIMMAWPHEATDWAYMLDEVEQCYKNIVEAITKDRTVVIVCPDPESVKAVLGEVGGDRVIYFKCPTNDTWTRDYGPICIVDENGTDVAVDYKFNGWGLKFASDCDNMVTARMFGHGVLSGQRINRLSFVLEGGSIDCDGKGTLITTSECLLSPNRNGSLSREEIEAELKNTLGVEKIVWINHGGLGGDDTDSHVDTLVRFTSSGAVVYAGCTDKSDPNYEKLSQLKEELAGLSAEGVLPGHLFELPSPSPIFDEDGQQLPATYANFLVTPTAVIMPTYGQPEPDKLASQILQVAFNLPVRCVDCRALIKQHGSLHCATMQIPRGLLSFV